MLKNTFQHIPGIGDKTEKQIWGSGIPDWNAFNGHGAACLSPGKKRIAEWYLLESDKELARGNPGYFDKLLPSNQNWRLFPDFRDTVVYLDIETTGLEPAYSEITTIAMYDGDSIRHYVNGQNLDDFKTDILKYKLIVSYNGKTFDIPFINSYFGIKLDHAHIDLRYILASLGFRGGLKRCEAALGIDRGDVKGIDGFFAVLLWKDYMKNGYQKTLETLLAYNIEDVVNLEQLMVMAYNMKTKDTPFSVSNQLDAPVSPEIPFKADRATVDRIKRKYAL
jgi:uncharacterized protein